MGAKRMTGKILVFVCLLPTVLLPAKSGAQQPKHSRVGFISPSSAAASGQYLEALRHGRDLGYAEGENLAIEARWADGSAERFPQLIGELTRLKVDIIVVGAAAGAVAAKKAGIATPVVFAAVTDPIGYGIIESLAQPGGNMTGTALSLGEGFSGKWVELLKEAVPKLARAAVLRNPRHQLAEVFRRETQAAGRAHGVKLDFVEARDPDELGLGLSKIEKQPPEALIFTPDPLFGSQRRRIVEFVTRHRLPAMFFSQDFAQAGGLMSYGPNFSESFRRAATYVDRILKGAKPADLPVEQPTKFELVINLKTAKQIGLTIPQKVLARADQVIR